MKDSAGKALKLGGKKDELIARIIENTEVAAGVGWVLSSSGCWGAMNCGWCDRYQRSVRLLQPLQMLQEERPSWSSI